jgi:uncharacterized membrane protein (UPF0182 family)
LGQASGVLVDWSWFSSVGYAEVFWTVFITKIVVFITIFAASAWVLALNGPLGLRLIRVLQLRLPVVLTLDSQPVQG